MSIISYGLRENDLIVIKSQDRHVGVLNGHGRVDADRRIGDRLHKTRTVFVIRVGVGYTCSTYG